MINTIRKHPWLALTILVTVFICAYEVMWKGWFSILLLPLSFLILPAYVFVQYQSLTHETGPYVGRIRVYSLLLTLFMLLFYVNLVGIGDTNDVLLFGFYTADIDSPLADIANLVATVSMFAAPVFFVILIGTLIANNRKNKVSAK